MKKLVLIDGHALLHRAYHAIPRLTTQKGELVNAVFGFTSMLLKVIADLEPSHLIVCFDRPVPTFRHKEFPQYQAQRPAMAQDLKDQITKVREVVQSFGIPIYEEDGYEADDLIGTLARQAKEETVIVTGDRDIFQLITDKVKVYAPKKGLSNPEVFDQGKFRKSYDFEPQQLIDFKALVGDPSDNYPGVAGIGPKTAIGLIEEYGTLDKIYKGIESIAPKTAEKLKKDEKWAWLSYRLAKIETQVPIKLDLKRAEFGNFNLEEIEVLFERLEFRSLLKRLPGRKEGKDEQIRLFE